MRYADIKKNDINNGEGLVVSLWVTGCPIKCPNCHNESIWDKNTGKEMFQEDRSFRTPNILRRIRYDILSTSLILF